MNIILIQQYYLLYLQGRDLTADTASLNLQNYTSSSDPLEFKYNYWGAHQQVSKQSIRIWCSEWNSCNVLLVSGAKLFTNPGRSECARHLHQSLSISITNKGNITASTHLTLDGTYLGRHEKLQNKYWYIKTECITHLLNKPLILIYLQFCNSIFPRRKLDFYIS